MKTGIRLFAVFLFFGCGAANASGETATCDPPEASSILPKTRQITAATCQTLDPKEDQIRSLVKRIFEQNTHELNRKVFLYHYGNNPKGSRAPVDSDDQKLAELYFYDKDSKRDYFDPKNHYGFYTANNPVVSLDYSRDPPLLLELAVPAGVRFLNTRNLNDDALSAKDAAMIYCYLCSKEISSTASGYCASPQAGFPLREFTEKTQESREMLRQVFKDLRIQLLWQDFREITYKECGGMNPEIIFIDPGFSPKLEKTLFTLNLEPNPSLEKKKQYQRILSFFDMIDASEIKTLNRDAEKNFWEYYKAWAPIVHQLPSDTDLVAFQKQKSAQMKALRPELTSRIFGCSSDPKYKNEILETKARLLK